MAKGRNNYFDRQIQRNGEDFIDTKPIDEIQRDAKRFIFQDMAFGNIDYEKYGHYFMEPRFLEQLIIVSNDEAENHKMKYYALREFDLTHPGDQRIISLCSLESRLACAYDIIHMHLRSVKDSGYNIACLPCLVSQIYQYRADIANN